MNGAITGRTLRDIRWHVVWYGLGLALYAALMVWLFPTFREVVADAEYPDELLAFFGTEGDLTEPANFLTTEFFSFAPVIFMIYGVVVGTGLLAGDEGRGRLESLLAQPVTRTTLFVSRVLALVGGSVAICALIVVGWLASAPFVDLGPSVTTVELAAATFLLLPIVWCFAALALLLSAVAPSRGMAAGIMTGIAIASYLLSSFAMTVEPIEWTRFLSPYYYSDGTRLLTEGAVWWHQALLLAATGLVGGLAVLAFNGREIGGGTWQPRAIARGWRSLRG
ncbi:MAG: ABC transporter permease subunit [Dehalococcoidia bacterium]